MVKFMFSLQSFKGCTTYSMSNSLIFQCISDTLKGSIVGKITKHLTHDSVRMQVQQWRNVHHYC